MFFLQGKFSVLKLPKVQDDPKNITIVTKSIGSTTDYYKCDIIITYGMNMQLSISYGDGTVENFNTIGNILGIYYS